LAFLSISIDWLYRNEPRLLSPLLGEGKKDEVIGFSFNINRLTSMETNLGSCPLSLRERVRVREALGKAQTCAHLHKGLTILHD
jgi:hypothetical protein